MAPSALPITPIMPMACYPLPVELTALIEAGSWPIDRPNRQDLEPLLGKAAARQLSQDDDHIVLMTPPFHTIADEVQGGNEFWTNGLTNVGEIEYEKALIIADFGLGSDSPIILYYESLEKPSVMYLRWSGNGDEVRHRWIKTHCSFADFATAAGLIDSHW